MGNNDTEKKEKGRRLNKKSILIGLAVIILLGGVTAGGLLKASTKPSFCSNCHIIKPYYQSWNEGSFLDHKHAQQDVACLDCHHRTIPEKAQEGLKYVTGNYELPLEGPPGDRAFCLSCHSDKGPGSSWEEIKAATNFEESNPHDSHNGEQDCNLCHKMHGESKPMCVQCHLFNWYDELGEGWSTEYVPDKQ